MGGSTRGLPGYLAGTPFAAIGGVLALNHPSRYFSGLTLTATVVSLLAAVLVSWRGPPSRRLFARGFALFGWAYFALAIGPLAPSFSSELVTTRLVELSLPAEVYTTPQARNIWQSDRNHTLFITHCLFTLIVGGLGGTWTARARNLDPEPSSET